MTISTRYITQLGGKPLQKYGRVKTKGGFVAIISSRFPEIGDKEVTEQAVNSLSEGFVCNYLGDEKLTPEYKTEIKEMARKIRKYSFKWSLIYKKVCTSLHQDMNTPDGELTIHLK